MSTAAAEFLKVSRLQASDTVINLVVIRDVFGKSRLIFSPICSL